MYKRIQVMVIVIILGLLGKAHAVPTGTLTFISPTGTVGPVDVVEVWLRLTLDPASEPLHLDSTIPGFGVNPTDVPAEWTSLSAAYINNSFSCSGNFTFSCIDGPPYKFNWNFSGTNLFGVRDITINPGESLDYLFGSFNPSAGPVAAGTYTFYNSEVFLGLIGMKPQLDANGDPVLDGNGDPVLIEDVVSFSIAQTCPAQEASCAFTRTVDWSCNDLEDPKSITCGVGVCAANGELICQSGQYINACEPGLPTGTDDDCDGLDSNCNGQIDENAADADNDGYKVCFDCDDTNADIKPGAEEICDGVDNNCDGNADEDYDNDGYSSCNGDCKDNDWTVNPSAAEVPLNGKDDDCDAGTHDQPIKWVDNGHYYLRVVISGGINWPSAKTAAEGLSFLGMRGHLVTVSSDTENLFLTNDPELGNGDNFGDLLNDHWLGGYQIAGSSEPDGGWKWVTNEDFVYMNWGIAEPNNFGNENSIHFAHDMSAGGKEWNDAEGAAMLPGYVVEFEPACVRGADNDGDGHDVVCDGDCDDADPSVNMNAPELCDGLDNNCNGVADEETDIDGDGFNSACGGDCNDNDSVVNPDAEEICDGFDNNCDGQIDEGFDNDGDGRTTCSGDCDDGNPDVYTGALELCDGLDNNCDGNVDEDFDGDGYTSCAGDCNDNDASVNPDTREMLCNGKDDDCNGSTPDQPVLWPDNGHYYARVDVPVGQWVSWSSSNAEANGLTCMGWPGHLATVTSAEENLFLTNHPELGSGSADLLHDHWLGGYQIIGSSEPDGGWKWVTNEPFAYTNWGNFEPNNLVGQEHKLIFKADINADGKSWRDLYDDPLKWGYIVEFEPACNSGDDLDGDGHDVVCGGDCDDADASVYVNAPELCDGIDNNCNDVVDEEIDIDRDGFTTACGGDCDDWNYYVNPDANEVCDNIDNNCDGQIDENAVDNDGDGYSTCGGDCNDDEPAVNPAAAEECDGIDNNCNELIDEGFEDADQDGYPFCTDCDENNSAINPGAIEILNNGIDDDCDVFTEDTDADNDGYAANVDCDDNDSAVHPGSEETAYNNVDDDCDVATKDNDLDGDGYYVGINYMTVEARANIFASGRASAFDGLMPPFIRFQAGSVNTITLGDVSGQISCCWIGTEFNGPDGGEHASGTTDILSNQGISGIIYGHGDPSFPELEYFAGRTMFLIGVFLNDSEPADPAPARLDFTQVPYGMGDSFFDIFPVLNQTFFIGDGLTGTGSGTAQNIHVPAGATRLYLGFADAIQFGYPSSEPGYFGDNYGLLNVTVDGINSFDCDDYNADIHPGAVEIPNNGIDENCDGLDFIDSDADGITDAIDNCPFVSNPAQLDTDTDSVGDVCDNCVLVKNADQRDDNYPDDDNINKQGIQHYGDACDPDFDNDGLVTLTDYAEWRKYYRQAVPPAPAYVDLDNDGLIGLSDYAVWRKYYRGVPGP